jgi:hypothetical protein
MLDKKKDYGTGAILAAMMKGTTMDNRRPVKRSIRKSEAVKAINESRLTSSERASFLYKIDSYPLDLIPLKELESMGLVIVVPGKITSEDKRFFTREAAGAAWMCAAGAVIIWCGCTFSEYGLQLIPSLFGTAGIMRGVQKLHEIYGYIKDIKAKVVQ